MKLYTFIYLFIFETEFRSCYPGWSAMARSRLTTTSASWVQAILLPRPPKVLGLQAWATAPGPHFKFELYSGSWRVETCLQLLKRECENAVVGLVCVRNLATTTVKAKTLRQPAYALSLFNKSPISSLSSKLQMLFSKSKQISNLIDEATWCDSLAQWLHNTINISQTN